MIAGTYHTAPVGDASVVTGVTRPRTTLAAIAWVPRGPALLFQRQCQNVALDGVAEIFFAWAETFPGSEHEKKGIAMLCLE
jgi:hypothetical protein